MLTVLFMFAAANYSGIQNRLPCAKPNFVCEWLGGNKVEIGDVKCSRRGVSSFAVSLIGLALISVLLAFMALQNRKNYNLI